MKTYEVTVVTKVRAENDIDALDVGRKTLKNIDVELITNMSNICLTVKEVV